MYNCRCTNVHTTVSTTTYVPTVKLLKNFCHELFSDNCNCKCTYIETKYYLIDDGLRIRVAGWVTHSFCQTLSNLQNKRYLVAAFEPRVLHSKKRVVRNFVFQVQYTLYDCNRLINGGSRDYEFEMSRVSKQLLFN